MRLTKIRRNEILTALLAAAVAIVLIADRGVSLNYKALYRLATFQTQPLSSKITPRAQLVRNKKSAESLYWRISELKRTQRRKSVAGSRLRAFAVRDSSTMKLPVPGSNYLGVKFNSFGMRGPELTNADGENTIIVAYLGSSITLDRGSIPDSKSWPARTTRALQQLYPDCRFVYQNAGVPGLSSRHLSEYYVSNVLAHFRPDIVMIMTDDRKKRFTEMAQQQPVTADSDQNLQFTRQQLLTYYETDLNQLLATIKASDGMPVLLGFGQRLRRQQNISDRLGAIGHIRGPEPANVSVEKYLQSAQWYNEKNLEIAAQQNIIYIDWQDQVPGSARYFTDMRHFDRFGSVLLAQVLAHELDQSETLRAALSSRHNCAAQGRSRPANSNIRD